MGLFTVLLLEGLCIALTSKDLSASEPCVLVSLPPEEFFVRRLLGTDHCVVSMIPKDANHETYEPTIAQLKHLEAAQVYFAIGSPIINFESRLTEYLAKLNRPGPRLEKLFLPEEFLPGDPHIWLAPSSGSKIANRMASALKEVFPAEVEMIEQNRAALEAEIQSLNSTLAKSFEGSKGKRFLVFHPNWGYFANELGLTQLAVEHEGKEPSSRNIIETIDTAKKLGLKFLFTDPQSSATTAQVIAEEIGAEVKELDPLATAWADNLRISAEAILRGSR